MSAALADDVLRRLGLDGRPPTTLQGLSDLYLAWCRTVPFDNLRKRQWLAGGAEGPPPGADSEDFFTAFLENGTGGTCWAVSNAITNLLVGLGFDARRVASSMLPFPEMQNRPNHGTTIVRFDDEQWLVDTSMLTEQPVRLVTDEETTGGEGILSVRVEPHGSLWRVFWKPWRAGPEEMPCEFEDDTIDADFCLARYQASLGFSPFNTAVYIRRGHPGGIRNLIGNSLVEVDRDGGFTDTDVTGRRDELLTEVFGYSEKLVAAIPPDEPSPS